VVKKVVPTSITINIIDSKTIYSLFYILIIISTNLFNLSISKAITI
jgi:hypothetical protein